MKRVGLSHLPAVEHPFYEGTIGDPLIWVVHRGGAGKTDETGMGMVENTDESIGAAWAAGFRYAETDVTDTSDGFAVHLHKSVKAREVVRQTPYSDLNTPSVHRLLGFIGRRIPRLEETLERYPDMRFFIDQKTASVPEAVARAIRATRAQDRVSIDGVNWRRTVQTRKLLHEFDISTTIGPLGLAALYMGVKKMPGHKTLKDRYLHGATSLSLPIGMVSSQMMQMASELQIPVFLYRVKNWATVMRAERYGARGVMIDDLALRLGNPALQSVIPAPPPIERAA